MAASRRRPRNRAEATHPLPALEEALAASGAPLRPVGLADVDFQLATRAERPFTRTGWWFELKYDGYRILAERNGDEIRIRYRGGSDPSAQFPELVEALRTLPAAHFILDGEAVVEDADGRPSFALLQARAQRSHPAPGAPPPTFWTFDLLACEGRDLRGLTLRTRRELLALLTGDNPRIRCVVPVETEGEAFLEAVKQMGLEGMVAKRADALHHAGHGTDWQKIVLQQIGDFAVVGHTPELTSLALATWDGDGFTYAGRVGSGLKPRQASAVERRLATLRRSAPAVRKPPPDRDLLWVEPELVAEVRYKEWPRGGSPRAPVFCRFRDDKRPEDCLPPWRSEERVVPFVNLDKPFWPEDGFSKGDLIRYYQAIARWMLPYLRDRPLMLTRFPDGIHGQSFFQKQAGPGLPGWVRTVQMEGDEGPIRQFVCDDAETLAFLVNLGTIPFHLWSARIDDLEHPDWCILDLDPKTAPFEHVVQLALSARELCDKLEIPSFVKTTGSSGLHVLVPLGRQLEHEAAISFGQILAEALVQRHPDIATTERVVRARRSRVYVDFLQNGRGRLLVAPYSARPLPGVPVSMPLLWSEVTDKLHPRAFTALDAPARMEALGSDPFLGVLEASPPDLVRALSRLQSILGGGVETVAPPAQAGAGRVAARATGVEPAASGDVRARPVIAGDDAGKEPRATRKGDRPVRQVSSSAGPPASPASGGRRSAARAARRRR